MNWITDYIKNNPFNWERVIVDHNKNGTHCARLRCGDFFFKIYGFDLEDSYHKLERVTKMVSDFVENSPNAPEAVEVFQDGERYKFRVVCADLPEYISTQSFMFKEEAAVYGVAQMALLYKTQITEDNGLIKPDQRTKRKT